MLKTYNYCYHDPQPNQPLTPSSHGCGKGFEKNVDDCEVEIIPVL